MEIETRRNFNRKELLAILKMMTVAILVGSLVYYVMDRQAREERESAAITIQDLERQITDLRKMQEASVVDSIANDILPEPVISGWKIYENQELGFRLNYPDDKWRIEEVTSNADGEKTRGVALISPEAFKRAEEQRDDLEDLFGKSLEDSFSKLSNVSVNRYASLKDVYGEDTIEDMLKDNDEVKKFRYTQVDGVGAVWMIIQGMGSNYVILFEYQGYFYEITVRGIETQESIPEIEQKIISSFRFL